MIEDKGGAANLVVWPSVFEHYRRIVRGSRMLGVHRRLQKQGEACTWWPSGSTT